MWNKINKQKKKKKHTHTNKQIIIQLTTITLVIYHRQQHSVTTSHRDRSPCAQISSNIEDHSPFWSHGQGMKHYTPSFLSFAFECARNWLHSWVYIGLNKGWNIYYSNFQITIHIITTNILWYVSMPSKRRCYTTFSIYIFLLYIASTRLSR